MHRVDGDAVHDDLPVEVGAGGETGGADAADEVAGADDVADGDEGFRHVVEATEDSAAVVDEDAVAAALGLSDPGDDAGVGREDGVAEFAGEVEAAVVLLGRGEVVGAEEAVI